MHCLFDTLASFQIKMRPNKCFSNKFVLRRRHNKVVYFSKWRNLSLSLKGFPSCWFVSLLGEHGRSWRGRSIFLGSCSRQNCRCLKNGTTAAGSRSMTIIANTNWSIWVSQINDLGRFFRTVVAKDLGAMSTMVTTIEQWKWSRTLVAFRCRVIRLPRRSETDVWRQLYYRR